MMLTVLLLTILAFVRATPDPAYQIEADQELVKLQIDADLPPDAKLNTVSSLDTILTSCNIFPRVAGR